MVEDAGQHNVSLDGLAICLGPDLRAMYPLVMNFGVEGELAVSGPAHPDQVHAVQCMGWWIGLLGALGVMLGRGTKRHGHALLPACQSCWLQCLSAHVQSWGRGWATTWGDREL